MIHGGLWLSTAPVKQPGDKGHFSTDVGQEVLDEALKAVEKHAGEHLVDSSAPAKAEGGSESQATEIEALKAELEFSMSKGRELMAKLKDEHDKMLRAVADFENYKKRALKEKDEVLRFGNEKLLRDLLPVMDNVDRALEAAKSAADFDSLRTGVEMIRKLFEDSLGKHGVKAFSAKGKPFDPNWHEAMSAAETTAMPPNHVHSDILRGYTLNERLMRPALVVVSSAPAAPAENEPLPPAEEDATKPH